MMFQIWLQKYVFNANIYILLQKKSVYHYFIVIMMQVVVQLYDI